MYIVYKGFLEVIANGKVVELMHDGDMLGKRAIETGEKRTADLKAKGELHLLCLTAKDYQYCLLVFIFIFNFIRKPWKKKENS